MASTAIAGVILDVGGTLWPDRWEASETDFDERSRGVSAALGIGSERAGQLVRLLEHQGALLGGKSTQDTLGLIADCAQQLRLMPDDIALVAVRRAMCLHAAGRWQLFPAAIELLATVKALASTSCLLTNGTWRDSECYQRDLSDLGISRFVDAVVTSVETGLRKPNPEMFQAALAAIDCPPSDCVMIGNSESNDIEPAVALGMRAVRVAIEEPRPPSSAAHAIAGSLHEAAEILRSWVWSDAGIA